MTSTPGNHEHDGEDLEALRKEFAEFEKQVPGLLDTQNVHAPGHEPEHVDPGEDITFDKWNTSVESDDEK